MFKRNTVKPNADFKKHLAAMKRQMNRCPKKVAKERLRIGREREFEKSMLAKNEEVTPPVSSPFSDDNDYGMEDAPVYQHTTTRETWERYTIEELVTLYVSSLAEGKPSLALTNPQQGQYTCQCTDKRTKSVTLYMMCGKILA
jgi:hypothetical protein